MFAGKALLLLAALTSLVTAQSSTSSSASASSSSSASSSMVSSSASSSASGTSTSNGIAGYSYTVSAGSVPIATANAWCAAQHGTCAVLCGNVAFPNTCDPTTLSFQCTCGNGVSPNITGFSNTLPANECIQFRNNCLSSAGDVATSQQACNNIPCGTMAPSVIVSASSTMSSSTTSSASGGASPSASSNTQKSGANAPELALSFGVQAGLGMIVGSLVFAVAL